MDRRHLNPLISGSTTTKVIHYNRKSRHVLYSSFTSSQEGWDYQTNLECLPQSLQKEKSTNLITRLTHCTSTLHRISVMQIFLILLLSLNLCTQNSHAFEQPNALSLSFSIEENLPPNRLIGLVSEAANSEIRLLPPFLIVPGSGFCGQRIDSDLIVDQHSGEIRAASSLDRERCALYEFSAIPQHGPNVHVAIQVLDTNDNPPVFPLNRVHLSFPENSKPREVKRALPPAKDLDLGEYGVREYEIIEGNSAGHFRLHTHREQDGVLYLDLQVNGPLDREQQSAYKLVVEARDGGRPSLSARLQVEITVLDVNDNEPQFAQSSYYGQVSENATLNTKVLRVSASDADQGLNARIRYQLQAAASETLNGQQQANPSPANGFMSSDRSTALLSQMNPLPFEIDEDGWIRLSRPLNYSQTELHQFLVVAKDSAEQPLVTSALCTIRVQPNQQRNQYNINLLFLTPDGQAQIAENVPIGSPLVRINIGDDPMEQNNLNTSSRNDLQLQQESIRLQLLSNESTGKLPFRLQQVRPLVYLLELKDQLDREQQDIYEFVIQANISSSADNQMQEQKLSVCIHVSDVNDNAPKFNQSEYQMHVPEWSEIGTEVGIVQAQDPDLVSSVQQNDISVNQSFGLLQYSIDVTASDPVAMRWFTVHAFTGRISTRALLDCEHSAQPQLVILASDGLHPPARTRLRLLIEDTNDNAPLFEQSFYSAAVAEDKAIGSCLLRLVATDADCASKESITYALESNDLLYQPLQQLRNSTVNLPNEPLLQAIGPFHVQPDSGWLCLRRSLDFEKQPFFEFSAVAEDAGGLRGRAQVRIKLLNRNDQPPIFQPVEYRVSVQENRVPLLSNGLPAPLLTLRAADSGRTVDHRLITYELRSGNEEQAFELDSFSGALYLLKPLSSAHAAYTLRAIALNHRGLRSGNEATIRVHVITNGFSSTSEQRLSLNDVTQSFTPSQQFQVLESSHVGHLVGKIKLLPTGRAENCTIYDGDQENHFRLQNNQLWLSKTVDYERIQHFLLNVQCTDAELPAYFLQLNVTILDVNDNAPRFESHQMHISISESQPVTIDGLGIFVAQALDADSALFGPVEYRLIDSNENSQNFAINSMTGSITLIKPVDFEQKHEHQLRIQARDAGGLSDEMTLLISIQDINDNRPRLINLDQDLPLILNVTEDKPVNEHLYQFHAIDADSGRNARLSYLLHSCETNLNKLKNDFVCPFCLQQSTGALKLQFPLDRESVDLYLLQIQICDHGQPQKLCVSQQVRIQVSDVNDNAPRCSQTETHFSVNESAEINTLIGQLKAVDKDAGLNGTVLFRISRATVGFAHALSQFILDEQTGDIRLRANLDREAKDRHVFQVQLFDQGTPSQISPTNCTVIVDVLDANDNRPVFQSVQDDGCVWKSNGEMINEDSDPPCVVSATDADIGKNALIRYEIFGQQKHDSTTGSYLNLTKPLFVIQPKNGRVQLVSTKEPNLAGEYRLWLRAVDEGGKQSKPLSLAVRLQTLTTKLSNAMKNELDSSESTAMQKDALQAESSHLKSPESKQQQVVQAGLMINKESELQPSLIVLLNQSLLAGQPILQFQLDQEWLMQLARASSSDLPTTNNFSLEQCESGFQWQNLLISPSTDVVDDSVDETVRSLATTYPSVSESAFQPPLLILSDNSTDFRLVLSADAQRLQTQQLQTFDVLLNPADCVGSFRFINSLNKNDFALIAHPGYIRLQRLQLQINSLPKICQPFDHLRQRLRQHRRSLLELHIQLQQDSLYQKRIVLFSQLHNLACQNQSNKHLRYSIQLPVPIEKEATSTTPLFSVNDEGQLLLHPTATLMAQRELLLVVTAHELFSSTKTPLDSVAILLHMTQRPTGRLNHLRFAPINRDDQQPFTLELKENCCVANETVTVLRPVWEELNQADRPPNVRLLFHWAASKDDVNQKDLQIDFSNGAIVLRRSLDFERQAHYALNACVSLFPMNVDFNENFNLSNFDLTKRLHQLCILINLYVSNVNDEPPRFDSTLQQPLYVSEQTPVGKLLTKLSAFDGDCHQGSSIATGCNLTFLIADGYSHRRMFELNSSSGELRLRSALDREILASYEIPLLVYDDQFVHVDRHWLQVQVTDVNDNQPQLLDNNANVLLPEWLPIGNVFYTLLVMDPDLNTMPVIACNNNSLRNEKTNTSTPLRFEMNSGNERKDFFLNEFNGELSVARQLNCSQQCEYSLNISVFDGLHRTFERVHVQLQDTNDQPPIFLQSAYRFELDMRAKKAELVCGEQLAIGIVSAHDSDTQPLLQPILFQLDSEYQDGQYVQLDALTGRLWMESCVLQQAIRRHLTGLTAQPKSEMMLQFRLFAVDVAAHVVHRSKVDVNVNVLLNQNQLNQWTQKTQTHLRFVDYPLQVVLNQSINPHTILLQAKIELSGLSYQERQLKANLENLRFLLQESECNRLLHVDKQTGILRLKQQTSRSLLECAIVAEATYAGQHLKAENRIFLSSEISPVIKVVKRTVRVEEHQPMRPTDFRAECGMKSFQSDVQQLYSSSIQNDLFKWNKDQSVIRLQRTLDYETDPTELRLVLLMQDQTTNARCAFDLRVQQINRNEQTAMFAQRRLLVPIMENGPANQLLIRLHTLDADRIPVFPAFEDPRRVPLHFHILEGNVDNAFQIVGNELRSAVTLDREIRDRYTLKIVLSENQREPPSAEAWSAERRSSSLDDSLINSQADSSDIQEVLDHCVVEVLVLDVNDNQPVLPPFETILLQPDADVGTNVLTIVGNDVDSWPVLRYERIDCTESSEDTLRYQESLEVSPLSGRVRLRSRLSIATASDVASIFESSMDNHGNCNGTRLQPLFTEFPLCVRATDGKHEVHGRINIRLRNLPLSRQQPYFVQTLLTTRFSSCPHRLHCPIAKVQAKFGWDDWQPNGAAVVGSKPFAVNNTETKSESNALDATVATKSELRADPFSGQLVRIIYRLGGRQNRRFYIDSNSGQIYNNHTLQPGRLYRLVVHAQYAFENGRLVGSQRANATVLIQGPPIDSLDKEQDETKELSLESVVTVSFDQTGLQQPLLIKVSNLTVGQPVLQFAQPSIYEYRLFVSSPDFVITRRSRLVALSDVATHEIRLQIVRCLLKGRNCKRLQLLLQMPFNASGQIKRSPFVQHYVTLETKLDLENQRFPIELGCVTGRNECNRSNEFVYELFDNHSGDIYKLLPTGMLLLNKQPKQLSNEPLILQLIVVARQSTLNKIVSASALTLNLQAVHERHQRPRDLRLAVLENTPVNTPLLQLGESCLSTVMNGRNLCEYELQPIDGQAASFNNDQLPVRVDSASGQLITAKALDLETSSTQEVTFRLVRKFVNVLKNSNEEESVDMMTEESKSVAPLEGFNMRIRLQLSGRDEFAPKFVQDSYEFRLQPNLTTSLLKDQCQPVGELHALDEDAGPDGQVQYSIKCSVPANRVNQFRLQPSSGRLVYCGPEESNPVFISLIVTANSGRAGSLSAMVVVDLQLQPLPKLSPVAKPKVESIWPAISSPISNIARTIGKPDIESGDSFIKSSSVAQRNEVVAINGKRLHVSSTVQSGNEANRPETSSSAKAGWLLSVLIIAALISLIVLLLIWNRSTTSTNRKPLFSWFSRNSISKQPGKPMMNSVDVNAKAAAAAAAAVNTLQALQQQQRYLSSMQYGDVNVSKITILNERHQMMQTTSGSIPLVDQQQPYCKLNYDQLVRAGSGNNMHSNSAAHSLDLVGNSHRSISQNNHPDLINCDRRRNGNHRVVQQNVSPSVMSCNSSESGYALVGPQNKTTQSKPLPPRTSPRTSIAPQLQKAQFHEPRISSSNNVSIPSVYNNGLLSTSIGGHRSNELSDNRDVWYNV